MKKLLILTKPLAISVISLLFVTAFLRYYLYVNSSQLTREFKNQNFREIYSLDSLKISSRLNSLSSVINWVCIEGSIGGNAFYKMERGKCKTGLLQQRQEIYIPAANETKIVFTVRLPKEVEILFALFFGLQLILITALVIATKKAEEEKRQNEIKMSKLARQMSHDIRSPLATLNTVIAEISGIPDDMNLLLSKSISRINEISNSLLQKNRNEIYINNQILPVLKNHNLNLLVEDVIIGKKIEYKNNSRITISFAQVAEEIIIQLDAIEFKRSLSNLINNSVEALRADGQGLKINIDIKKVAAKAILTITDNGVGIPQDVLAKIGAMEFSTKKNGNGLGIIHTYENIANWKGSINIKSEINSGTIITIELPVTETKIQKNMTVLIDDDELVRLTWTAQAKKHHIDFCACANLAEFNMHIDSLSKESHLYIDSNLADQQKGEDLASFLADKGFSNIYLATGHPPEKFSHLKFLKGVRGKSAPW